MAMEMSDFVETSRVVEPRVAAEEDAAGPYGVPVRARSRTGPMGMVWAFVLKKDDDLVDDCKESVLWQHSA